MIRILWLLVIFLLIPQAVTLGFSSSQSTLSASPNDVKQLNLFKSIQSFVSAHKSTPNASDAYTIHPGFIIDISGWIEKSSITIAVINGDGNSGLTASINPTSPGELLRNATIEPEVRHEWKIKKRLGHAIS